MLEPAPRLRPLGVWLRLLLPRPSGRWRCGGANELTAWGSVWLIGSRCRGARLDVTRPEILPLSQACGKGAGPRRRQKPRASLEALVPERFLATGSLARSCCRDLGLRP